MKALSITNKTCSLDYFLPCLNGPVKVRIDSDTRKSINQSHKIFLELLKDENLDKVFKISEEIAQTNIEWHNSYAEDPNLKAFYNSQRWGLLDYVILCSATHKIVYQQDLAIKLKVSVKTVYSLVNEYIDSGHFIKLDPAIGSDYDKRVVNIRPSVKLTVAYLDSHIEHVKRCINFLKNHTRFVFD